METQQSMPCPNPEAHVTPEQRMAELERLDDIVRGNGFEVIPLPIIDCNISWQMQRGDRIYARFTVSHMTTLVTEPKIETDLRRMRQFAQVAQAHPAEAA